jgi:hypothetical protein
MRRIFCILFGIHGDDLEVIRLSYDSHAFLTVCRHCR